MPLPSSFKKNSLHTVAGKTEGVVQVTVFKLSAESKLVFTVSDLPRTEYRADDRYSHLTFETAKLVDPSHVEVLHATVRECSWMSECSAFSVAKKNPPAEGRVQSPILVNGEHAF